MLLDVVVLAASRLDLLPFVPLRLLKLENLHLCHICVVSGHLELFCQISHLLLQGCLRWRSTLLPRAHLSLGLDIVTLVDRALHVGYHNLLPPLQLRVSQSHAVDLPLHCTCLSSPNLRVKSGLRFPLECDFLFQQHNLFLGLGHIEQQPLLLLLESHYLGLARNRFFLELLKLFDEARLHQKVVVGKLDLLVLMFSDEPIDLPHLDVETTRHALKVAQFFILSLELGGNPHSLLFEDSKLGLELVLPLAH
mmetsp:Transcript_67000/g.111317  ORF Transcript_67000/g.111317 Transcript_67000/m.111317 type:complete len:251 (-) Transcript_67000:1642-2394(-)